MSIKWIRRCRQFGLYKCFLLQVHTFKELNLLPNPLTHLIITVVEMFTNEARWHKSCYNTFSNAKLGMKMAMV